jgi:ATP-dependent DNA helicase RecG
VRTTDGFEIADVDLKLRGPGDLEGTQQSGVLDLRLADLAKDQKILLAARQTAEELLAQDPELAAPDLLPLKNQLAKLQRGRGWSRIS